MSEELNINRLNFLKERYELLNNYIQGKEYWFVYPALKSALEDCRDEFWEIYDKILDKEFTF